VRSTRKSRDSGGLSSLSGGSRRESRTRKSRDSGKGQAFDDLLFFIIMEKNPWLSLKKVLVFCDRICYDKTG